MTFAKVYTCTCLYFESVVNLKCRFKEEATYAQYNIVELNIYAVLSLLKLGLIFT
jgi:hypothetical protein